MMTSDDQHADDPELQLDRAIVGTPQMQATTAPSVSCAMCKGSIGTEYYSVNGASVCAACRRKLEAWISSPGGAGRFLLALLFGLGAAIAGAIAYYAVIALTHFEIGIVAILIGYMVGYSVHKGARGRGGLRLQILAVVLTYWAVGLAYSPLVIKQIVEHRQTVQSRAADSPEPARPSVEVRPAASARFPYVALARVFAFVFVLPILVILGSMPSGLISAFIIFIGMRQAWRMTAARKFDVSGPYRVGAAPALA